VRARRGLCPGLALALAGCLAAVGCGGSGTPSTFAYDRSSSFRFADAGVVNHGYPIKIHDVSFASARSGRVHAYLVVPPGKGPFPAVIWAHGSGGTRQDLILPATWLAARGAVSLVVDDPFERDPQLDLASDARQRAAIVQQVIDLRRSVDLLQSRKDVDPKLIGFMGLSFGAMQGALLAGTEPRIEAFDLQSGRGRTFGPGIDDLTWIRRSHAAFLFQLGLHDKVVPRAELVALAKAAPEPKEIRWYDAGHPLNLRANHDQLRWLAHELGLGGPVVRGAVAGP
jgi:dienelactone hydrolase